MKNSAEPDRGIKAWLCALARSLGLMAPEEITATHHPEGAPGRILLMRHAEKTGDPNDILLSPEGVVRAARLVTYIPKTFGRPDFIYAAARSKRSIRSIETVKPLAAALNIEVQHHIEDRDFKSLITEIFSKPEYRGKMIVICWHHKKLPEIASLLGAREGSYPAFWPQNVFNLILDFRYDPKSDAAPVVGQIVQPF
ncbi:histidine phosphatase family protein [Hyphomicrobium sp. 2TAF46]|uniref:histidine phosphatase family protein n=1 Tax=Hyphomicrobium sp. 2TAF46 TaxID=3233019 RepID=UPI003F8DA657